MNGEREKLSENQLYCLLEDRLLEHGEATDCPETCTFFHPCQALWSHISDHADEITTEQFKQFQMTFDFFFDNMLAQASIIKVSEKNPYAVRLAKMRAASLTAEQRRDIAILAANKRWKKAHWWDEI